MTMTPADAGVTEELIADLRQWSEHPSVLNARCQRAADHIASLKKERDELKQYQEAAKERDEVRKENTILRGLVQRNPDWKCTYGFDIDTIAKCPSGFPGCGCADDILLAEDEAFKSHVAATKSEVSRLREALKPFAEMATKLEQLSSTSNDDTPIIVHNPKAAPIDSVPLSIFRNARAALSDAPPREREGIDSVELLAWLRARPGASWQATINDVEQAVQDIRRERGEADGRSDALGALVGRLLEAGYREPHIRPDEYDFIEVFPDHRALLIEAAGTLNTFRLRSHEPPGCVLVPEEPTEEMKKAGRLENPAFWTSNCERSMPPNIEGAIYRAMLAARPARPSESKEKA